MAVEEGMMVRVRCGKEEWKEEEAGGTGGRREMM
jgi:hypothetical protein